MEDGGVDILGGIELVNDVDGLGRHAEGGHEGVEIGDLLAVGVGRFRDEVVELDPEHDLALLGKLGGKLLGHGHEVVLLIERLAEELAQFRVNGFRVIVAQEAQRGVDFLLQHDAVHLREGGQHLDEQRQQVGRLQHGARLAHGPPGKLAGGALEPIGHRRKPANAVAESSDESVRVWADGVDHWMRLRAGAETGWQGI